MIRTPAQQETIFCKDASGNIKCVFEGTECYMTMYLDRIPNAGTDPYKIHSGVILKYPDSNTSKAINLQSEIRGFISWDSLWQYRKEYIQMPKLTGLYTEASYRHVLSMKYKVPKQTLEREHYLTIRRLKHASYWGRRLND